MTITRERFEAAMTPAQYIAAMEQKREQFEANLAAARITEEERRFFAELPAPLPVLVLSENWCPDCTTNVPIILRLAEETGKLTVRLLKRDGNEDIAAHYTLADGRNHIPTYIIFSSLFDGDLHELGSFLERPDAVTHKLGEMRAAWYAAHPEVDASTPLSEAPPELRAQFLAEYAAARRSLWELEQREIIAGFRAIASRAFSAAAS